MSILLPLCAALLAVQTLPPGGAMTVESAIAMARANSPRLRAARCAADASQVQVDRERPIARPTVTISAEGTIQGPAVSFPRSAAEDATVLPEQYSKLEVRAEQTIWRPGLSAARDRYGAQSRLNAWEYLRAESDLVLDVRRSFHDVVLARAMAAVASEGLDVARRHREQIANMLQAGLSSERDLKAADADQAEAEQGVTRANNGLALAEGNLNRLLGRAPGTAVGRVDSGALPTAAEAPDTLYKLAEDRRPELNQLREGILAAQAGAVLARLQDKPSIAARATAARQTASAFVDRSYFAGGFVLTWNLLDGGKTRADTREAEARCSELRDQLDEALLGIRLEVEKAWRDMRDARARIEAADRQVESARAALAISEARYEVRMATQIEVSGAALSVTRARGNREEAVHDLFVADADLRHAIAADIVTPASASERPAKPHKRQPAR